jgi:hypothetical protein
VLLRKTEVFFLAELLQWVWWREAGRGVWSFELLTEFELFCV